MPGLTSEEKKTLFDYFDSVQQDGKISVDEVRKAVSPDLDGDSDVTNLKLYKNRTVTTSKHTGRAVPVYTYSTVPDRGEAYIVGGHHVSEQDLGDSTFDLWMKHFQWEIQDGFISLEEFKRSFD